MGAATEAIARITTPDKAVESPRRPARAARTTDSQLTGTTATHAHAHTADRLPPCDRRLCCTSCISIAPSGGNARLAIWELFP